MYNGIVRQEFCFSGSADKIAMDKALVSAFRKANGMDANPHGPVVGSPGEVEQKLALIRAFRSNF